jgi:putative DNA primase/helicase
MNADLPLVLTDGAIRICDKAGREILIVNPADPEAFGKWWVYNQESAAAERQSYWSSTLKLMGSACDSAALLTDIQTNGHLEEIAASMAGHAFGTDARILFGKLVRKSGVLDGLLDAERVIFQIWEEACEEPGDWRWLVKHVRELEESGGDYPPEPPATTAPPPQITLCRTVEPKLDVAASSNNSSLITGGVKLICGADIEPEPIDWLWPGWLARGKLHIIAGAPGCGKTTDALSFAATLTSGGEWPDGTRAPVCDVLMWSAEDDIKNTLLPRFMTMGGNRNRIHFVKGADGSREFDPSTDMAGLRAAAEKLGNVGLIIVDPIVSAVTGDSHKNTEVRRSLQPLVDLAQSLNAVLLGITHFSKGTAGRDPIDRVNGSLAFGAVARLVFAAAKVKSEETGEEERIFVRAKSNIGPDGGGFKFELKQVEVPKYPDITASTVKWGESLEGAARDLLKEAESTGESGKTEDAAELIQETVRVKGGEASATDLHAALKAAGIGKHNRYRAIDKLLEQHRIARVRYAEGGPWTYIFPRRGGVSAFDPAATDDAAHQDLVGEKI